MVAGVSRMLWKSLVKAYILEAKATVLWLKYRHQIGTGIYRLIELKNRPRGVSIARSFTRPFILFRTPFYSFGKSCNAKGRFYNTVLECKIL